MTEVTDENARELLWKWIHRTGGSMEGVNHYCECGKKWSVVVLHGGDLRSPIVRDNEFSAVHELYH